MSGFRVFFCFLRFRVARLYGFGLRLERNMAHVGWGRALGPGCKAATSDRYTASCSQSWAPCCVAEM